MGRTPNEPIPQQELLYRLRAAIDTARKYPSQTNIDKAVELAIDHPKAMRSSHISHNLGVTRWEWLGQQGVVFTGEAVEIAGTPARKATITPEVKK